MAAIKWTPRYIHATMRNGVILAFFTSLSLSSLASICLLMICISLTKVRKYFLSIRRGIIFGKYEWCSSLKSSPQPCNFLPWALLRVLPRQGLDLCFCTSAALCIWEHMENVKQRGGEPLSLAQTGLLCQKLENSNAGFDV